MTCPDSLIAEIEKQTARGMVTDQWLVTDPPVMQALLSRLKKAEAILAIAGHYGPEWDAAWKAWRASKGKK